MVGFVHFSNFLIPSEKYYNSQSCWITLYQKMLTSKLLKTIRKGRVGSREDRKEEASLSDNLVSVKKCSISLITHISQKHLIF